MMTGRGEAHMRKFLIGLAVVLVALGALVWVYQDFVRFMVIAYMVTPSDAFDPAKSPPAPDYAQAKFWVALPTTQDGADKLAPGETDGQANAPVDVFFVYPTTYLNAANWNAPFGDAEADARVTDAVLPGQASVFNACCKIYAPRYRQATFASYLDQKGNGTKALALAYKDVEAAWDYYLANYNNGRPFILAGHSQGAGHIFTLLANKIAGTERAKQMIAAYPIGATYDRGALPAGIPVCDSAEQTGCVVSWNSVGPEAPIWRDTKSDICVNPLTWSSATGEAAHDLNLGSLSIAGGLRLVPKAADANCVDGRLIVSALHTTQYDDRPMVLGKDNYHIIDYGLFYLNLRRNAQARTDAYLKTNAIGPQAAQEQ